MSTTVVAVQQELFAFTIKPEETITPDLVRAYRGPDRERWVLRELLKHPTISPETLRSVLKASLEGPRRPPIHDQPNHQLPLQALLRRPHGTMRRRREVPLPASVQEIADVIGRERALYLVGQLPRCYPPSGGGREQVLLYVPKKLTPTHRLVKILGWDEASRLADEFGGEILKPGNCRDVYRQHRDAGIVSSAAQGIPLSMISSWFQVSIRHIQSVLRDNE